ncbi:LPS-assembly lipoprotein [Monaibacterium marinum]|uniref:LPS-assembly lipoprotein n=1 Tax=Pontivivens marinum TaxID=1690039 RepID=A0A2C9CP06_9RHOB|nr:LPS assembly lipoprotein LptE [Monaibacterium marinum]SOH92937.1 LPS-assembly lipoprotein [Monaibacterium marinum]
MSLSRRHLLATLALAPLAGCGFEPLYGSDGAASQLRGQVRVTSLGTRDGYFLRERLLQRFGAPEPDAPLTLSVTLVTESEALSITQTNDITRYNLSGTAAITLREAGVDEPVLRDELSGDASYNAPSPVVSALNASTIAAREAEQDAERRLAEYLAEQIADRVLIAAELLSQ